MKAKQWCHLPLLVLTLAALAAGQTNVRLPCDYSGKLLRNSNGGLVAFSSEEMKQKATNKTDISDFMRSVDFRDTHVVEVLVGQSGEVVCVKTVSGLPIASREVEKAVRTWTFKPAKVKEGAVAYIGWLEFYLCNIDCAERGMSMSIVK